MEPITATIITTAITALVSAVVGAIVGAVVAKIKTVTHDAQQAADDAKRERAELKEIMTQNIVMTCRMAIYDDHFSVDEKVEAYAIYRDLGGNHQTKKYMDELVGCDIDEYIERHRKKD